MTSFCGARYERPVVNRKLSITADGLKHCHRPGIAIAMNKQLTSAELRIAARQAITLAMSMSDEANRTDLILRAGRLFEEAEAALMQNTMRR